MEKEKIGKKIQKKNWKKLVQLRGNRIAIFGAFVQRADRFAKIS